MTRPGIVRADTIDLQDRDAPSAKDHSHVRAPTSAKDVFSSPPSDDTHNLASHQAETLRGVAAETAQDRRISWTGSNLSDLHIYGSDLAADIADTLNLSSSLQEAPIETAAPGHNMTTHQQQDALAVAQNGGLSAEATEEDMDDVDDEGLDDDMMDKISSSPSIEDGGYTQNSDTRAILSSLVIITKPNPCAASCSSAAGPTRAGGSLPASCRCNMARPPHTPKHRPSAPVSENTFPLQVSRDNQASKAPIVSLNRPAFHQRRRHGKYDMIDFSGNASLETPSHDASAYDRVTPPEIPATLGLSSVGVSIKEPRDRREICFATETDEATFSIIGGCWDVPEEVFDDMMIPYFDDDCDDDDDDDDNGAGAFYIHNIDSKFVVSGWGSECLHNIEDIDFEFVYALHTFMATVEGQANATKGDTMVLLDDSNSYWWLVRVVKDSSIGYLPAEHIETPTERLARLNKHRNIDLSASMLGDQAEKTKNPLKSAMRRRKTKTVAFAPPTFVDYSDIEYSTDEEDLEAEYFAQQQQSQQQQQQQEEHKEDAQQTKDPQQQQLQNQPQAATVGGKDENDEQDETAKVEPLKPRAPKENGKVAEANTDDANDDGAGGKGLTRTSEEIFVVSKSETPGPKKTKDGTVRDSFFKDDTVETKKITLTPNLLRDDSAPRASSESKDLKPRPSLDRLDKDINSLLVKDDKKKKDKKEKDKKPGGFRSLFSRKDKKRGDNEDDESFGKRSMDIGSETTDRERDIDEMDEEPVQEKAGSPSTAGPQRQPSKLQKQQPLGRIAEVSPTRKPANGSAAQKDNATMRMVDSEGAQDSSSPENSPKEASPFGTAHKSLALSTGNTPTPRNEASRPQMVAKASARAVLDEFESDEEVGVPEPQRQAPAPNNDMKRQQPEQHRLDQQQQQKQQAVTKGSINGPQGGEKGVSVSVPRSAERLSESPVQVSPVNSNNPPALMVDTSSQEEEEEDQSSPISSPSPELVESEDRSGNHGAQDSIATSTSATTANTATWNDASLRAFFDSGTDVRDLLVVVYDKTDVVPAGPDHPVVSTLFKEQNAKLAEITTQLDNMLGDWLARKQRVRGTL